MGIEDKYCPSCGKQIAIPSRKVSTQTALDQSASNNGIVAKEKCDFQGGNLSGSEKTVCTHQITELDGGLASALEEERSAIEDYNNVVRLIRCANEHASVSQTPQAGSFWRKESDRLLSEDLPVMIQRVQVVRQRLAKEIRLLLAKYPDDKTSV
jgi:hypothetical protein